MQNLATSCKIWKDFPTDFNLQSGLQKFGFVHNLWILLVDGRSPNVSNLISHFRSSPVNFKCWCLISQNNHKMHAHGVVKKCSSQRCQTESFKIEAAIITKSGEFWICVRDGEGNFSLISPLSYSSLRSENSIDYF